MLATAADLPSMAHPLGQRRVLLAVTGLTPQVVTETLHALMREGEHALPHEVHIVTTAEGAERARPALLSEQPGWFHRFMADYELPSIAFDSSHIHILQGSDGEPLADIRSAADNACAADQIAEYLRRLTAVADKATVAMRQEMQSWRLGRHNRWSLEEGLARIRPVVTGSVKYYGLFYPSKLYRALQTLDQHLVMWARRKYKGLARHTERAWNWLAGLKIRLPRMFPHWFESIMSTGR